MKKYTIGIDFGTLSARAVLLDLEKGNEVAVSEYKYPHAVMSDNINGVKLDENSAFQHPQDYIEALSYTTKDVVKQAHIKVEQVVGIGVDFTGCTMLPVDADFKPLCMQDEFKNNPMAYVKLWKHHSAQPQADYITEMAEKSNEKWLTTYGGKVSSEWLFPKILETVEKAPEVYECTEYFVEAGDWIIWFLTGNTIRNCCMAGFKGSWTPKDGYPSNDFLKNLNPKLDNIVETKLRGEVKAVGTVAGTVTKYGAELTGLSEGTVVAVPCLDAHAGLPAGGIAKPGQMMLIIGTSGCHIMLDKKDVDVPGTCGKVEGGLFPDYSVYESGQCCIGDMFDWFVKNCVPFSYKENADRLGISVFDYLEQLAEKIPAGENKILALDWWNGNRTPYVDNNLTGAMFGFTLGTKPEEMYRALIESAAFGTKVIFDLYEKYGVEVKEVYASGGISLKNKLLMQIYSDVTGKEIKVADCKQGGAVGSAMFAAYASGEFETVEEAVKALSKECKVVYKPNLENTEKYKKLYDKYVKLSEMFAKNKQYFR